MSCKIANLFLQICILSIWIVSANAQTVLRNGTFRAINSVAGAGGPGDGYEANLYAYYKCEETSSPAVDSAHARNVPQQSCTIAAATTAGFIGNGFQIKCANFLKRSDDGSGDFEFSGSFTVRLWIHSTETADANFENMVGETSWNVLLGDGGNAGKIDWEIVGNSSTYDVVSAQTINDGSWHEVFCWWDNGTGEAGVQIDNNSPTTTTTGDTIFVSSPPNQLFFGGANYVGTVIIDEVAIWTSVLTSGDRTFDFNSGAGRGYPLP